MVVEKQRMLIEEEERAHKIEAERHVRDSQRK